jgi:hypothetical protein
MSDTLISSGGEDAIFLEAFLGFVFGWFGWNSFSKAIQANFSFLLTRSPFAYFP